ncbi:hypothetical protein PFICI_01702 [Pestalotiopsis fici W106-1]|uniref:Uncharacterized protein n=1 Tax=Pestalotiopsis fici (strain W106-1 / CGMCC3.15140) TaxID=1229662 RepID=W3XPH6_PESFW|nr:uncharacterized protein PFICI_01702 [Pestalotiopsis fici W106-1]ETS87874.1 hypothetical protein PFICI_01702 [Pestalotiopsis fici W106-1]
MASGFGPDGQAAYKTKKHVLPFQDHTGNPAVWRGRATNPLPRLYCYAIYFTHTSITSDLVNAEQVYATVTDDPIYGCSGVEYRLDLFNDQIELVSTNGGPTGRLPGPVSSYVQDPVQHGYHSLIYMFDKAAWPGDDQLIVRVEFDPLSKAGYEADSKDPEDPQGARCSPKETCHSRGIQSKESGIR